MIKTALRPEAAHCEHRTHSVNSLAVLSLVACTPLLFFGAAAAQEAVRAQQHFATRKGTSISIQPSGASLEIPKDWAARTQVAELKEVRRWDGEWKTEYTKVVNAALPFSQCSVQAGEWDWRVSTFSGVTVRGYVLNRRAGDIEERISAKGLAAAQALPHSTIQNVSLTEADTEQWHRILIKYDAWYYDYGGRANVDFYVTERNGTTIVLVFMYVGMDDAPETMTTVQQILKSFSW